MNRVTSRIYEKSAEKPANKFVYSSTLSVPEMNIAELDVREYRGFE